MIAPPRFVLPPGTELKLLGNRVAIAGRNASGYDIVDLETGEQRIVPFAALVDYLKLPGTVIDPLLPQTGGRLQQRLGGFTTSRSLPKPQQDGGMFHLALCQGVIGLREKMRAEAGNDRLEPTIGDLNHPGNRQFVKSIAQTLFGFPIILNTPPGGKRTVWTMPRGRTLLKHFKAFEQIHPDESPLDVLVPLHHLRGNRTPRITHRTKELMTRVWEEVGLDTKDPSLAAVHRELKTLIRDENAIRVRNGLRPLAVPCQSTLKSHRDNVVTELQWMVATKGERYTRNSRGRGSTDVRALLVGEYVEIDECKASLVVSAKVRGMWERLSPDERATLEEMDKLVRERLHILVMIDVATRMPLAWVISDQPRAEATLALFRMATRDKTREKRIYGCEGEPMPAIGIGHVKNDNGPGLRNAEVIGALMGMGAMNTVVRTYAATDKPLH